MIGLQMFSQRFVFPAILLHCLPLPQLPANLISAHNVVGCRRKQLGIYTRQWFGSVIFVPLLRKMLFCECCGFWFEKEKSLQIVLAVGIILQLVSEIQWILVLGVVGVIFRDLLSF